MTTHNVIRQKDLLALIHRLYLTFEEKKDFLSSLDTEIGDGDHGFSMFEGFRSVDSKMDSFSDLSIDQILKKVGIGLINSIGGASGAVFGTFFLGQASYYETNLNGQQELTLKDLGEMLNEALLQVMKRGGAQTGDKTMLDALQPAVEALVEASTNDLPLSQGFKNAASAALQGAENTRAMQAMRGRARNLGQRSVGYMDPGAMSTYYIFETISKYIDQPE